MHTRKTAIITGLMLGSLILAQPFFALATMVKTYYKQYSIFTFENQDYLCEPYQVQKNDWLYKIFRQKGEISAKDFPLFLRIFMDLNPKLSNIDAIEPGHQILIPLKRIDRQDFEQQQEGVVEVPVVQFAPDPKDRELADLVRRHTVSRGDTLSTLLDKAFLKKGGSISPMGEQVLKKLNPDLTDINRIYLGSRIVVPDPAILNQPWFQSFLGTEVPPVIPDEGLQSPEEAPPALPQMSQEDLTRLERYARLVQGTLRHRGTMVFPGKKGHPPQTLDLSKTPVLFSKTGEKTLLLPPDARSDQINQDLLAGMKAYWKDLKIQEMNKALAPVTHLFQDLPDLDDVPQNPEDVIRQVVPATASVLHPPEPVSVRYGTMDLAPSMARITREGGRDILINPGLIYGQAVEALESAGKSVLTLSPGMTYGEILLLLFSKLDFTTWKNPSFNAQGRVTLVRGIYATTKNAKLFVTRAAPPQEAATFLESDNIRIVVLKEEGL